MDTTNRNKSSVNGPPDSKSSGAVEEDLFPTDYVAKLLEQDARNLNRKFQKSHTVGLATGEITRNSGTTIRPNTTFLRNLIQQSDSHNRLLLEREREQARERLRETKRETEQVYKRKRRRESDASDSKSHRHSHGHHQRHKHHRQSSRSKSPDERNQERDDEKSTRRRLRDRERSKNSRIYSNDRRPSDMKTPPRSNDKTSESSGSKSSSWKSTATLTKALQVKSGKTSKEDGDDQKKNDGQTGTKDIIRKGRGGRHGGEAIERHFEDFYDPKSDVLSSKPSKTREEVLDSIKGRLQWTSASGANASARHAEPLKAATREELRAHKKKQNEIEWPEYSKGAREWDRKKVIDEKGFVRHGI